MSKVYSLISHSNLKNKIFSQITLYRKDFNIQNILLKEFFKLCMNNMKIYCLFFIKHITPFRFMFSEYNTIFSVKIFHRHFLSNDELRSSQKNFKLLKHISIMDYIIPTFHHLNSVIFPHKEKYLVLYLPAITFF